jgi:toxin ParE1/3/4
VKRYAVRFLAEAIVDLDRLYFYVAEGTSYETADRYLARIERLCLSLATFPKRGTAIRGNRTGLRSMGFERSATILFRVGADSVEILRVLHYGRDAERVIDEMTDS